MKKPPDPPPARKRPKWSEMPAPMVLSGPPSGRSEADEEHEASAAKVREHIRFTLVTRFLNDRAPAMDRAEASHYVDWVLQYYLGDLGALLCDAESHRRRVASLKKSPTIAEIMVVRRLRDRRREAEFCAVHHPDATVRERERKAAASLVASLAEELQATLAELARDDPERPHLEEMYRVVRRGSARVQEMYARVLPHVERLDAFWERLPPEDDPAESDE